MQNELRKKEAEVERLRRERNDANVAEMQCRKDAKDESIASSVFYLLIKIFTNIINRMIKL